MRRTSKALLAGACAAIALAPVVATPAAAIPPIVAPPFIGPSTPDNGFYTPPSPLPPGTSGDIIKAEPSPLLVSLPGPDGLLPAAATRFMYRSTDAHGSPIAVTGTYFDPGLPWNGPGPRPLVSVAPGTMGQGDQCAPSKLIDKLIQYNPDTDAFVGYEILFAAALLAQGYAVVMTDYEGLGTPGPHTYMNRASQGHTVLDAIRAAQRLPGTKVEPGSPVGIWGYSQGGGGAGAAAELRASYAPELNVVGVYVGAPPANLRATLDKINGTALSGVAGYALNGLVHTYPEVKPVLEANITDQGRQFLAETSGQCAIESIFRYIGQPLDRLVTGGRTLNQVIDTNPVIQRVLDEQALGRIAPDMPVMVSSSPADDQVPHEPVRQLVADWCGRGATVEFTADALPPILPGLGINHIIGYPFGGFVPATLWLQDRFAGVPAASNC